jgi:hypothetical protein
VAPLATGAFRAEVSADSAFPAESVFSDGFMVTWGSVCL